MRKLPNFAGAEKLSLMDLQALAEAVEAQERVLPPAVLSNRLGSRKYSLANFNLDTKDSCTGEAWPNNPGLVSSMSFTAEPEPRIVEGELYIPLAHHVNSYTKDDDSIEQVSGGVRAVYCTHQLHEPQIARGDIHIPYAMSSWEDDCEGFCSGISSTAGVVYAVQFDGTAPRIDDGIIGIPLADSTACGGAVTGVIAGVAMDSTSGAYISGGVLHLPSGGGGDDDCCGGCTCVLAQYNNEASADVAGLIASVEADEEAEEMSIADGAIKLPMADESLECEARAGLMKNTGQFSESLPTDGCDGWVQSLYLPMQSANGGSQIVSYRQLVRICNGQLQVSAQRCLHPDGNWEAYFNLAT